MSKAPVRSLWAVFRWPTWIALATLAGLLAALVGDDLWDAFGWLALAPAVLISVAGLRRALR